MISYTTTYRARERERRGECEVLRGWREDSGRGREREKERQREREGGVTKSMRERDRDKVEES